MNHANELGLGFKFFAYYLPKREKLTLFLCLAPLEKRLGGKIPGR